MREIKFRAWDKITERILEVEEIEFIHIKPVNPVQKLVLWDNFNAKRLVCDWRRVELMQFTGLKDKHHNEIYEGDILIAMYAGSHIYHGVVIFDAGSFCLKITQAKSNCRDYALGNAPELNNFDQIKIIGNIYENPELIGNGNFNSAL